jgi:hypothetical protein
MLLDLDFFAASTLMCRAARAVLKHKLPLHNLPKECLDLVQRYAATTIQHAVRRYLRRRCIRFQRRHKLCFYGLGDDNHEVFMHDFRHGAYCVITAYGSTSLELVFSSDKIGYTKRWYTRRGFFYARPGDPYIPHTMVEDDDQMKTLLFLLQCCDMKDLPLKRIGSEYRLSYSSATE